MAGIFLLSLISMVSFFAPESARAQTLTDAQRAQLQAQLTQVEAEEAQAQTELTTAQGKSASLSQAIAVLDAKIKTAQLKIQAENLLIQTLGSDIVVKQSHINDLLAQIASGKQTLAELLRRTNELDQYSLPEVILSQSTVSGFFQDVDQFQSVQSGLQSTFNMLTTDEASTSAEKDALTIRQNSEMDAKHTIQTEQANVQADEKQQKQLLTISKGNERSYTQVVAQEAAQAAQIRAALFKLNGAQAIPFGTALAYANTVSAKTGVQPAFLLAILTQETNIGGNVGTCYLTDTATGAGVNSKNAANISKVMKPSRDVQPFLSITSALGLDYKSMPVSCPQSVGYGGGMGPAQFIASTWVLPDLNSRIKQALGTSAMPNPWDPQTAFMASGIFLSDLGADSSSYSAQKNAACRYYSGSSCGVVSGATSYGNSVMALADSIQQNQIDPLQGN